MAPGSDLTVPASPREREAAAALLAPWRAITDPVFHGLDNVPARGPMLLVGNHTIYGLLDLPLMVLELDRSRGVFARGLAEHAHFAIPGWRDLLVRFGAVRGTRDNCRALLAAGEAVLVYPGGGREVAKRRDERYHLIWKQRLGFARMAIEAQCPIVPFGAVGAEEAYDIVVDADSRLMAPARAVFARLGGRPELMFPLARGIGPTLLPRPERFYFAFGEPIRTTRWKGRADDERALRALRDRTRRAVEGLIDGLRAEREADPERDVVSRVRARMGL